MAKAALQDIAALKRYLGHEAPFLGARAGRRTGLPAIDRLLDGHTRGGGLPTGALAVIRGAPGSGRSSLAAHILARETESGRPVAWLDVHGTLYPPALVQAGVHSERLLIVRSEPDRAIYAAERLLESGAFRWVVLSGLERQLGVARARRLQSAAEAEGATALLLVDPRIAPRLTAAALELSVTRRGRGLMVEVDRDRLGPSGKKAFVALDEDRPPLAA